MTLGRALPVGQDAHGVDRTGTEQSGEVEGLVVHGVRVAVGLTLPGPLAVHVQLVLLVAGDVGAGPVDRPRAERELAAGVGVLVGLLGLALDTTDPGGRPPLAGQPRLEGGGRRAGTGPFRRRPRSARSSGRRHPEPAPARHRARRPGRTRPPCRCPRPPAPDRGRPPDPRPRPGRPPVGPRAAGPGAARRRRRRRPRARAAQPVRPSAAHRGPWARRSRPCAGRGGHAVPAAGPPDRTVGDDQGGQGRAGCAEQSPAEQLPAVQPPAESPTGGRPPPPPWRPQ